MAKCYNCGKETKVSIKANENTGKPCCKECKDEKGHIVFWVVN